MKTKFLALGFLSGMLAFSPIFLSTEVYAQGFPGISATKKQTTSATILSDVASVPAGASFNLLVKFKLDPHWHVYWKNPGSVGMPLSIDWQNVPAGIKFGEWIWSTPKVYNQEGIVNYVYENEGYVKIPVSLPANLPVGELLLSGNADWLACDDSGCHPTGSRFSVAVKILPADGSIVPANTENFAQAEKFFPKTNLPARASFSKSENTLSLAITPNTGTQLDFSSAEFFPELEIFNSDKTIIPPTKNADGSFVFPLELNEGENLEAEEIKGVIRLRDGTAFSLVASKTSSIKTEQANLSSNKNLVKAEEPAKTSPKTSGTEWIPWTLQKQNELVDAGKIVYIDFTARWCATCQVNKRVYADDALQKKFADSGVVLMRADWTKKNPEIAEELAKYQRAAVPFNIFLKKGQAPYILPEAFAGAGTVIDALDAVLAGKGSDTSTSSEEGASILSLIILAFVGGLILNLMPCVFPVLGLKIMHFVGKAGDDKKKIALHGLIFGLGVLISFWILAGILIILRSGGSQLGWGFQLQSPIFVFAMVLLMFVFGLSMSGVFEFGVSATSAGGSLTQKSGFAGSFFSGVLAVIIATPCAAPFLAPALGAALALEPLPSLGLFTCIAVGLAFPYVLLSVFPKLLKFLPKPGEWMESFKQAMAFLLYAPAAYFVWVLMGQVDDPFAQRDLLISLAFIALACWIYGRWGVSWKPARTQIIAKSLAAIIFVGTCIYVYTLLSA